MRILKTINVLSFNTSNLNDMSSLFAECKSLISIDLSNFDTTNVENIGSMFYYCSSLKSIDLSNFNTTNVNNFYYIFGITSSLKYIDISSFTTNLTSIPLFAAQSTYGVIKIRKEFYDKIKTKLDNWIINYVN